MVVGREDKLKTEREQRKIERDISSLHASMIFEQVQFTSPTFMKDDSKVETKAFCQ
jgi:hypothetical protein